MVSRLKTIFPDDWQYILKVYRNFLCSSGARATNEKLLLTLIEIGVRLGERISQLHPNGFVEIGCGLAIPSLTLAKLGHAGGKAIDIDAEILSFTENLRDRIECALEIECSDVFKNRPELQNGKLLITEKPASYKKNILEVEHTIRNWCAIAGHNLAMIPSYMDTDTPISYSERCEKYEKKLRQVGFKVENNQACEELPFRWLIAIKNIIS